jgi:hypothetical protein
MVDNTKFEETVLKLKLEEQQRLLQAESDPRVYNLLNQISEISNNKINNKCGSLIERLNQLSKGDKFELDEKMQLNINPKEGKEDEYFKIQTRLEKCLKDFNTVHFQNMSKLAYIVNFRNKANDKCIDKCRSINNPNDCIRDCINFNIINTRATNDLIYDEFMKYFSSINKL